MHLNFGTTIFRFSLELIPEIPDLLVRARPCDQMLKLRPQGLKAVNLVCKG